jgi:hypothetical protein
MDSNNVQTNNFQPKVIQNENIKIKEEVVSLEEFDENNQMKETEQDRNQVKI